MGKVFLRFQLLMFIVGVALFFLFCIFSYLLATTCVPINPIYSPEQIKDCHTPFCDLLRKGATIHNEKLPVLALTNAIFINNIRAAASEITAYQYYGFAPVVGMFQMAVALGYHARCNLNSAFLWLVFPHGWLEVAAVLVSFSLFYSTIINLALFLIKKNKLNKQTIKKIALQIAMILALYLVAAILESMSFIYWR